MCIILVAFSSFFGDYCSTSKMKQDPERFAKTDGYKGIWYFNQPSNDEYRYKYSGGLGTYCAKHIPLAYYAKEVEKTFFCYGGVPKGENRLLHMISYYDHRTGMVPRPTILLDKQTDDAHDNPTLMLDGDGYIWIFSSSHGTSRPSYIHKSNRPYSIDDFEFVQETNFSYPQPWYLPEYGFLFLHTKYVQGRRILCWMTSPDGRKWNEAHRLAGIQNGHYQISWRHQNKVGTAFNYHPSDAALRPETPQGRGKHPQDAKRPSPQGVNYRTNVYYLESSDFGNTWRNVQGEIIKTPLEKISNSALVHDYQAEGLLVYLKDLNFDTQGNPIIMFLTSKGYASGPKNSPHIWRTARWDGARWDIRGTIESDSNYDTGCLHIQDDGTWRIIGPTERGPQPYNPGGEMALWVSPDQGRTWIKKSQITRESPFNHTYARRPVNAHPDFYAFWADGHAREPSDSRLYFCNQSGEAVRRLPFVMKGKCASPEFVE